MHIATITSFICRIPLSSPMKMGGLLLTTADNLFVRIETAAGQIGWGEGASAPTMTGETAPGMLAAARWLTPYLQRGRFDDAAAFLAACDASLLGNAAAKSALEMAFLDASARERDVPMHALLGPPQRDRIEALWILAKGTLQQDVDEARQKSREGWKAFKVKVGMDSPEADAERTRAVIDAVGAEAHVCADANQGYTPAQAAAYLRLIDGCGVHFMEQPIAGNDEAEWLALTTCSGVPLGIDESLHSAADVDWFQAKGLAAGGSFKAIKMGGITPVFDSASRAADRGFEINIACKVAESSIATAAVVHLAAALPQVNWGVSLTNQYLARDIAVPPVTIDQGHARVPTGPGLGITVDEDALRALRVADDAVF